MFILPVMDARHYNPTKLTELRKQTGLTQAQVAEKLKKQRQLVNKAEQGKPNAGVSYDFLCDLTSFYGLPVTEILYPVRRAT